MGLKKVIDSLISNIRPGDISISRYGYVQMEKYGLNENDIEDAWRYGKDEGGEKIVRRFSEYSVTVIVRKDGEKNIVINCWKFKTIDWMRPKKY